METLFFAIILLSFYSPTQTQSEWIVHSDNTIPRDDTTMAVGSYNGSIYLIGGVNRYRQQTIYDIKTDTFVFYKSGFVPENNRISGQAQHWTQMGFKLYFLNVFYPENNKISVFNMKDNSFISDFDTVPKSMSDGMGRACVASSAAFNRIYINGGLLSEDYATTETIVLNLDNGKEEMQWEMGTQMKIARTDHSCIIHPNGPTLYSIGGNSIPVLTRTIEKVGIEYIHDNPWTFFNGNLSNPSEGLRSFIYGNNIIIIGGLQGRSIYNTMHILDTENNLLTVSEMTLAYGSVYSAAIMVDGIMYSFGGRLGEDMDLWQSFTTPPTTSTTPSPVSTVTGTAKPETPTASTTSATNKPATTNSGAFKEDSAKGSVGGLSPAAGDALLCSFIVLLLVGIIIVACILNKRANAKKAAKFAEFERVDDETDKNTNEDDVMTFNNSDSDSNANENANKTPINADGTKLIQDNSYNNDA